MLDFILVFVKLSLEYVREPSALCVFTLQKGENMTNYNEFKNQVLGKGFDIDGSFGNQCWDGYAKYCQYLGVPYANCTVTGYAHDIWEQRQTNGTLNHFDEASSMQSGDIVVFKVVSGWTPYSHIAIFDSDAGGGYGWFLGQNQGAAGGVFNLVKLPYSATYDTVFRRKGTSQITTNTQEVFNMEFLITFKDDTFKDASTGHFAIRRTYHINTATKTFRHVKSEAELGVLTEIYKKVNQRDMQNWNSQQGYPIHIRAIEIWELTVK